MFRGESDEAVLCDLGSSRITASSDAAGASSYDGHGGTLLYLAPELLEREARSATRASDMCVGRTRGGV